MKPLCLSVFALSLFSCDRADTRRLAETKPSTAAPNHVEENLVSYPPVVVVMDTAPAPKLAVPMPNLANSIFYRKSDSFQGMWNHDRRNFNLRMNVVRIDANNREIEVTASSDDYPGPEKQLTGKIGEDGRTLKLKGVPETGLDQSSDPGAGYHILDLLQKGSTQGISLTDCNTRQLRGSTDKGSNVYFWTKLKENVSAER